MKITDGLAASLLLACVLSACGADVATVELALDSDPPESVETISVFVTDLEAGFIVASATVSRERTRFPMGVPAERLLEFTLIGRRLDPPLSLLGPMPSYVGRLRRRIPLGSERELVSLVARPGGAVTVFVPPPAPGDVDARPRLEVQGSGDRPTRVYDLARQFRGWRRTLALESGPSQVRLVADRRGRQWSSSALVQLRRDEDTLVQLDLPIETSELEVVPSTFKLSLLDPTTDESLEDELVLGAEWPKLLLTAEGLEGQPVEDLPDLRLHLRRYPSGGEPIDLELGVISAGEPFSFDEVEPLSEPERWWIWGELASEPPLRVDLFLNFRAPEEAPGVPATLFVDLQDEHRLARGTSVIVSALDESGLWARNFTAEFDLSDSDSDIVLGEVKGLIGSNHRGIRRVQIQRSSAPITGETVLRGTVTSTSQRFELERSLPRLALDVLAEPR